MKNIDLTNTGMVELTAEEKEKSGGLLILLAAVFILGYKLGREIVS